MQKECKPTAMPPPCAQLKLNQKKKIMSMALQGKIARFPDKILNLQKSADILITKISDTAKAEDMEAVRLFIPSIGFQAERTRQLQREIESAKNTAGTCRDGNTLLIVLDMEIASLKKLETQLAEIKEAVKISSELADISEKEVKLAAVSEKCGRFLKEAKERRSPDG